MEMKLIEWDNSITNFLKEWVDIIEKNKSKEDTYTEIENFSGFIFKNLTFTIGIDPAAKDKSDYSVNVNYRYDKVEKK